MSPLAACRSGAGVTDYTIGECAAMMTENMAPGSGPGSRSQYAKTRPVQIRTDAQLRNALVYSWILILQVLEPQLPSSQKWKSWLNPESERSW
jgi:hypothetical protein